jgi:uracil-DNA glycosylase
MTSREPLPDLLARVRACRQCERSLPHAPRPVVQVAASARLLLVGQAPGRRVHESGIPWDDASGERLRSWLGMTREPFYNARQVAIVPVGFCYPGKGKSGDLPPRPECAEWHPQLLARLPKTELTILIGRYAQQLYLGENCRPTLTQTVEAWRDYLPRVLPLPHPSPRNQAWWKARPWFEAELVPELQRRIATLCA